MATLYQQLHYSNADQQYLIKIIDKNLVTSSNLPISFGDDRGVMISRRGDSEDSIIRIVPTVAELSMQVITQADQDFYDALVTSKEGRYFLIVDRWEGTSYVNIFKGQILADLSPIEDKHEPVFTLTATCGLQQLESIRYYEDNPLQYRQYISHIRRILRLLPVVEETYDFGQPFIWSSIKMKDENHPVTGYDPLTDIRVRNYFFQEQDGAKVYAYCSTVLYQILASLNARIYQDRGVYVIEQISTRVPVELVDWQVYNKTGALIGTTTYGDDLLYDTDDEICADLYPLRGVKAPVKQVTITQEGEFLHNILFGETWDVDNQNEVVVTTIEPDQVNGVNKIWLTYGLYQHIYTTRPAEESWRGRQLVVYASVDITIKVDDGTNVLYYVGERLFNYKATDTSTIKVLKPPQETSAGTIPGVEESTTPGVMRMYMAIPRVTNSGYDPRTQYRQRIETPVLSQAGVVTVQFSNFQLYEWVDFQYAYTFDPPTLTPLTKIPSFAVSPFANEQELWSVENPVFLIGGELEDAATQSNRTTLILNDPENSLEMSDGFSMVTAPNTETNQKIQVWDGTEFVDATGWRKDPGEDPQRLAVQVARDIISLRGTHTASVDISLYGSVPIQYINRVLYKANYHIWLDYQLTTQDDTVVGTLWQLIAATAPTPPIVNNDDNNGTGLPPGFTVDDDDDEVLDVLTSDEYYAEKVITGSTIDVSDYPDLPDPANFTMLSINSGIMVHIGADLMHIVDTAPQFSWQCRIDFTNKTLILSKDMTGRLARIRARPVYTPIGTTQ